MGELLKQMGQGLAQGATSAVGGLPGMAMSAGSGLLGGLIQGIFAKRQAKQQFKYQQRLMAQQQQYNMQAFEAENERQNWLMTHEDAMKRRSLEEAGYSTANPQGTGVSTPAVSNMDTPSGTAPMADYVPQVDIAQGQSILANARLQNSQASLNEIEAQYRAQLLGKQIDKMNTDIKIALDTLPETIKNIQADTAMKISTKEINEKQGQQIDKNIEQLGEVIKGLQIDNRWKEKNYIQNYEKTGKEIALLAKEGRIKEAEARLADMGIVLGADGLTTLIGVIASGQGEYIMTELANGFGQLIGMLPQAISEALSGLWDGITDFHWGEKWENFKKKMPWNKNKNKGS